MIEDTFAALSDPTRRAVIDRLRRRPERAGDLAEALGLTPPTMSRHLKVLRTSGLVEEDHGGDDARVRVYRLRQEKFDEMQTWLDEVKMYWAGQLAAFKAHFAKKKK